MIPFVSSRVQGCFYSLVSKVLRFVERHGKLRQMKLLRTIAVPVLLATCLSRADAQAPTYSILHVEFLNSTLYSRGYCGQPTVGRIRPNSLRSPGLHLEWPWASQILSR